VSYSFRSHTFCPSLTIKMLSLFKILIGFQAMNRASHLSRLRLTGAFRRFRILDPNLRSTRTVNRSNRKSRNYQRKDFPRSLWKAEIYSDQMGQVCCSIRKFIQITIFLISIPENKLLVLIFADLFSSMLTWTIKLWLNFFGCTRTVISYTSVHF
jgi:hypothetical protein